MGPGLLKILEMIKATPAESMLIDRFLVLAADLGEFERVEATLKLASSLVISQPRRAIEVAWMTYKSGHKINECLEIIIACLERLQKFEKAELIRGERNKVESLLSTDEIKKIAKITIEEHIANVVGTPGELNSFDAVQTSSLEIPSPETSKFKLQSSPIVDFSLDGLTPQQEIKNPEIQFSNAFSKNIENSSNKKPAGNPQRLALTQENFDLQNSEEPDANYLDMPKSDSIVRIAINEPNEGMPAAIPPKEPSKYAVNIREQSIRGIDGGDRTSIAAEDSEFSQPRSKKKRKSKRIDSQEFAREDQNIEAEQLAFVTQAIAGEDWEQVLLEITSYISEFGAGNLLPEFEKNKLFAIDLRFATLWVDVLLLAKQERRALRFLIQKLSEEPQLSWAKMAWNKASSIWTALDLKSFEWREIDGVAQLRNRLASMQPKLGCYLIAAI